MGRRSEELGRWPRDQKVGGQARMANERQGVGSGGRVWWRLGDGSSLEVKDNRGDVSSDRRTRWMGSPRTRRRQREVLEATVKRV
jgi:hypothetical protein